MQIYLIFFLEVHYFLEIQVLGTDPSPKTKHRNVSGSDNKDPDPKPWLRGATSAGRKKNIYFE